MKKNPSQPRKRVGRTSDGITILHQRYARNDRQMATLLETERTNAQIAARIRELREQAGLSQRALAKMVDTTASVICRLEDADYRGHSLAMLNRIAAALDRRIEIKFVPTRRRARRA